MAQSIDKPPFFNGEHYAYWKNRMMFFIKAKHFQLWDIVEDGPFVPTTSRSEWSANDRKKMELNCKALHIIFCALGPNVYAKVSSCESAKEVWDKLELIHEGTNDVKETKIGLLKLEYENFKMDPNEDIKSMFDRFSTIVNQLKGFGEEILEDKLIRKLIYSFTQSWDSKKTAIIEAKDLKKLKLDELIGSLLTHEMMSIPLKREREKIIKEQGVDVNIIALKSSKCKYEDSSMEESSGEDEKMAYLFKNFTRFMKSEKEKSKHEPKKKMKESLRTKSSKEERHTKYDCPRFNKKGSSSKKAYVATWSDEEDSTENEVANLCFMALEEGEAYCTGTALCVPIPVRVSGYWKFQKPKGVPIRATVPEQALAYRYAYMRRTDTPKFVPVRNANRTDTPTAVPIRNANRTCTPTVVPIRMMQKLQRLVSEEHVPIRLRLYWYRMHQNSIYEGKKCLNGSKTSPTVTNG
ncbi:hypothetical protein V6N12_020199 [Hibiscus sabdariffa]|uniref:DUF4219 domain-containing protein n=1 Tax=Hibiscus sabdariffa TaxID=183260 RepID=A0ABR2BN39_9ROSI